jgi:hypothetical protein
LDDRPRRDGPVRPEARERQAVRDRETDDEPVGALVEEHGEPGRAAAAVLGDRRPSVPPSSTGNTTRPSGSGALEATECGGSPSWDTHRIGEPSGLGWAGSSNVVPTTRNVASGDSVTIVATRLGLPSTLTVKRSGRAVSLPSASTDISRMWSGPREWSTYSVPVAAS